jgi:WD40 repeat protein
MRVRRLVLLCLIGACGGGGADAQLSGGARDSQNPARSPAAPKHAAELPLPAGALQRLGGTRFRDSGSITGIALSPDGRFVAGGWEGTSVWSTATGERLFPQGTLAARVLGFAGDALVFAEARDPLTVVSTGSWTERRKLAACGHEQTLAIAPSPDGSQLAAICSGSEAQPRRRTLRLQSVSGGDPIVIGRIDDRDDGGFAWSGDGSWLAIELVHGIEIVDVKARRMTRLPAISMFNRTPFAFAPTGAALAYAELPDVSKKATIRIRDLAGDRELAAHPVAMYVGAMAWSRDGKTLALTRDNVDSTELASAVTTLDIATGTRRDLASHSPRPVAITFDRGNRLWLAVGNAVVLWDLDTDSEVIGPVGHRNGIAALAYRADGTLASASFDHTMRIWQLPTGSSRELRLSGNPHNVDDDPRKVPLGAVIALAWSQDGTRLYEADDGGSGSVRVWDPARGVQLRASATRYVKALARAPDESLVVETWTSLGHRLLRVAPDGHTLWDHDTGAVRVAVSPDGTRAALALDDKRIRLLDMLSGDVLEEWLHPGFVRGLAFSPDNTRLAINSESSVMVVRLDGRDRAPAFTIDEKWPAAFAFTPDGRLILAMDNGDVLVTKDGAIATRFHAPRAQAIAVAPDGKTFATGGYDGGILIWPL